MTLKRKTQIALFCLLSFLVASGVFIYGVAAAQKQSLADVNALLTKANKNYTVMQDNAQTMQYNIVQVQQYLSDLGATRGMISPKDTAADYTGAQENVDQFVKLAAETRALAAGVDEKEIVVAADEAAADFPAYYDVGKEMARVYIDHGAEAGNKLMPQFDAAADKLQEPMNKIVARTTALYTQSKEQVAVLTEQAQQGADRLLLYTFVTSALILLFVVIAAVLLIGFVIRPLGGFAGHIQEIAQGNLDGDVKGDGRKDEIGDMARAVASLKTDLLETFKLREMLQTMPYNVMYADPQQDFKITFCNKGSLDTLKLIEQYLPRKASEVVGANFDIFHKEPSNQRKMLADPKNLPHRGIFKVGPETILLIVSALYDKAGRYIGPMAVWELITQKMRTADDFEKNVKSVVETVTETAGNLTAAARALTGSAEQTSHQAVTGAAAAEEASANVHTVAAASEELSASISEITQQVSEASRIAQAAAAEAGQTNAHVNSLAERRKKSARLSALSARLRGRQICWR